MSSPKIQINKRKPFDEAFHGLMYDLFRRAGVALRPDQISPLRGVTAQISRIMKTESRLAAIQDLKELQDRILNSFKIVGSALDSIESRLSELEKNFATNTKVVAKKKKNSDNNKEGVENGSKTL